MWRNQVSKFGGGGGRNTKGAVEIMPPSKVLHSGRIAKTCCGLGHNHRAERALLLAPQTLLLGPSLYFRRSRLLHFRRNLVGCRSSENGKAIFTWLKKGANPQFNSIVPSQTRITPNMARECSS